MTDATPAPLVGYEGVVGEDWIDANGHMNVAWYDRVFDEAESRLFEAFAIDDSYIRRSGFGTFRVEKHIVYEREIMRGDRIRVDCRIVSTDERVIRHAHELVNVGRGERAAISRAVSVHVDLAKRKVVRCVDPAVTGPLRALARLHALLPPLADRR